MSGVQIDRVLEKVDKSENSRELGHRAPYALLGPLLLACIADVMNKRNKNKVKESDDDDDDTEMDDDDVDANPALSIAHILGEAEAKSFNGIVNQLISLREKAEEDDFGKDFVSDILSQPSAGESEQEPHELRPFITLV